MVVRVEGELLGIVPTIPLLLVVLVVVPLGHTVVVIEERVKLVVMVDITAEAVEAEIRGMGWRRRRWPCNCYEQFFNSFIYRIWWRWRWC